MKLLAGSYDNGSTVTDEQAILLSFQVRSREVYLTQRHDLNIPYGDAPREVFDWFYSSAPHQGTLIFIHGGYWQYCDKDDFAFIASVPLSLGFDVVLLEYTLAPSATLTEICQQIGVALEVICARAPQPVYLCGHSAGGHLAAYWQQHPGVRAVIAISGIFELDPLQTSAVNQRLHLTAQQIAALSPARDVPQVSKPVTLFYGADELPELIGQSLNYAFWLRENGVPVSRYEIAGANHFSILEALFSSGGALCRQLINHGEGNNAHYY